MDPFKCRSLLYQELLLLSSVLQSKKVSVFLSLREWPAMEPIADETENNLSVDAYMSPPILIFDVLTCYGDIMSSLCCPFCLKSGQSSNLRPTGLWTDGTSRCVYELRVVYDVSCSPVYDICRLQTADCRLQTGSTRKILITVTSPSTIFPVQNNINLVAKILLDFLR